MLELLTGPLVRAQANSTRGGKTNWGNVVIAIDPTGFQPFGDFTGAVSRYAAELQALTPAVGHDRVMTPGQRGREAVARVEQRGTLLLAQAMWAKLEAAAQA